VFETRRSILRVVNGNVSFTVIIFLFRHSPYFLITPRKEPCDNKEDIQPNVSMTNSSTLTFIAIQKTQPKCKMERSKKFAMGLGKREQVTYFLSGTLIFKVVKVF